MSRTQMHRLSPPLLSEKDHVSPVPNEATRVSQPVQLSTPERCSLSTSSLMMNLRAALWRVTEHSRRSPQERYAPETTSRVLTIPGQSSSDLSFVSPSLLSPTSTATTGVFQPAPITTLRSSNSESVAQSNTNVGSTSGSTSSFEAQISSSEAGLSSPSSVTPTSILTTIVSASASGLDPQLSSSDTSLSSSMTTSRSALTTTPGTFVTSTLSNASQFSQRITTPSDSTITTSKPTVTSPLITPSTTFTLTRPLPTSKSFTSILLSSEPTSFSITLQTSTSPILSTSPPFTPSLTTSFLSSVFTNTITFSITSIPSSVNPQTSPSETTEVTSPSITTAPTPIPSSPTLNPPTSLPDTTEVTTTTATTTLPSSTSTVTTLDPPPSTITTPNSSTSTFSNIDVPTITSVPPTSSDTLTATSYEPTISSTTSELLPAAPPTSSAPPAASSSSSALTTESFPPTLTMVTSLPSITSEHVFTSSSLTTKYWSSTLPGGGMTTLSTVIETGALSTNRPGNDKGFAHNTGAIIGVALAGTFSLIMAVIVIFFACHKYKRRRAQHRGSDSEARGFSRTSWHPPLEGDDDDEYYPGQYPVLSSHTLNRGYMDPEEAISSAPGAQNIEGTLSPPISSLEQGYLSDSAGQVALGTTKYRGIENLHTTGGSSAFVSNPALAGGIDTFGAKPRASISRSRTSHTHTNTHTSNTHTGGGHSAVSLNTGSSTHDHATASTSSGHRLVTKAKVISDEMSGVAVENTPVSPILYSGQQQTYTTGAESDGVDFRGFLGRLRRDRDSVPTVVFRGISTTSSYEEPHNTHNTRSHFSFLNTPSSFSRKHGPGRNPPASLNIIPATELWPAATLPPSPTPSEHSRTLEGLLTPHLEMRLASSERSSFASLRDNVDYSRPISGPVRNRVHSTMTFQTEDTAVTSGNADTP